ncbi:hypothetical protein JCM19237_1797 [Photobacterium aphoticum]|uniref:Uncharacterized protein n=1 Tax=Photobacterium aphoticum TaxID=754436 RepID=A0A090RF11_9GAMM|nr:hypothetical protein JCM19237_1797 [Photobacterium aphoticum]
MTLGMMYGSKQILQGFTGGQCLIIQCDTKQPLSTLEQFCPA